MTIIIEVSRPWQWRPGRFRSRLMTRVWWGFVAIAWLHVSYPEYVAADKEWRPGR